VLGDVVCGWFCPPYSSTRPRLIRSRHNDCDRSMPLERNQCGVEEKQPTIRSRLCQAWSATASEGHKRWTGIAETVGSTLAHLPGLWIAFRTVRLEEKDTVRDGSG